MKKITIISLLSVTIIAIASPVIGQPRIGEFTRSQMIIPGDTGCGLSLARPNNSSAVFLSDSSVGKIIIDGRINQLRLIKRKQQKIKIYETYRSADNKIIVDLNLKIGKQYSEGYAIDRSNLRVSKGGQQTTIVVVGYDGC